MKKGIRDDGLLGFSALRKRWECQDIEQVKQRIANDEKFPKPYRIVSNGVRLFLLNDIVEYEQSRGGIDALSGRVNIKRINGNWTGLTENDIWMRITTMRLT